jgi:hypothetical protein
VRGCCGLTNFFERKKETNKIFDDAPWVLTITQVALECQDTVGPAHPCHDAWLIIVLTDVTKRDMRKCARDRSSLADLRPMRWVMPHRQFLEIISSEIVGGEPSRPHGGYPQQPR